MVKYYHGTTLWGAKAIYKSNKFTHGTLIKNKKIARTYAERNTRLKMGGGGVLLELIVEKDYGYVIDINDPFRPNKIKEVEIKKIKGWKV